MRKSPCVNTGMALWRPLFSQAAVACPTGATCLGKQFIVKAECVSAKHTPRELYETILHGIRAAKRTVSLASLYLGNGDLEAALIDALSDAVSVPVLH